MIERIRTLIGSVRFLLHVLRSMRSPNDLSPALYIGSGQFTPVFNNPSSTLLTGWYLACPKKRRTLEKRRIRKFLSFTMDKYRPRTDLVSCTACGHLNPMGFLCVNCYDKVREETNRLRALISNQLPSDHEIRFVYEDDPSQTVSSNDEIIKVPHSRPSWFPIHFLRRFRPAS
ncbi:unnamed protein product [Dicrocoelium dendriticum]|nr:unnamed protein product [Dicrocoelium dendriticum]